MLRAIAIFLVCMPAMASEPMLACRAMEAAEQRLECYDRTLDALYPASITPSSSEPIKRLARPVDTPVDTPVDAPVDRLVTKKVAPLVEPVASVPVVAKPAAEFGQLKPTPREQQKVTSTVRSFSRSSLKKLIITMENQQVWQQIDSQRMILKFGDEVIIRTASLNSYKMSKASGGRSIRVRRIR